MKDKSKNELFMFDASTVILRYSEGSLTNPRNNIILMPERFSRTVPRDLNNHEINYLKTRH